ncbi:hypothetical protein NOCA1130200 [metagenome]|uniref:Uncharacterized protein n=1 Tax=metagenome TaxID=256318 RepID=A0A2P2CA37_9ZZZZ
MTAPDDVVLSLPFGCAWVSDSLYRQVSEPDPFLGDLAELADVLGGTRVEVDGWDEALASAWAKVVGSDPAVVEWASAYRDARGSSDLVVSFSDATRVVGRKARDYFSVTYPAHLLLGQEDRVAAMRRAIVTILDRHVRGAELGVPPLSEVYAAA